MAQETAVGYIISQLRQLAFNENTHLGMGDVRVTQGLIDELEEQAKQMESEQHEMMFNCGRQYQLTGEGTFKQVYEELYESNT